MITTNNFVAENEVSADTEATLAILRNAIAEAGVAADLSGFGYASGRTEAGTAADTSSASSAHNTVTISVANPALVSWPQHGLLAGQAVWFQQTAPLGFLPTGLLPGILYYVIAAGLVTGAFQVSATLNGPAVITSGTQSGVINGFATSSVLNTFCPPVGPSPGTKNKPEIKIKAATFGDGYTQETRDGLNHIRKIVSLQWDVLGEDDATAIENFLETQGGDLPFYYALRGDITRKWSCKDYDRSWQTPNKVSATFRQSFSPLV